MNLSAPTIDINSEASEELIKYAVPALKDRENPYVILSKEEATFMQTLWTKDGYVLEYQEGSVDNHFVSQEYLSSSEAVKALLSYLEERQEWKNKHKFYKKNFRDFFGSLGYVIGLFIGGIIRGFKKARSSKT